MTIKNKASNFETSITTISAADKDQRHRKDVQNG